jgi:hypothetical protein
MKTPTRDQVNAMSSTEFFTLPAELMKRNPPSAADADAVAAFAAIGLEPGKGLDAARINAEWDKLMPDVAYKKIMLHFVDRGGSGNLNSRDEWFFRATAA